MQKKKSPPSANRAQRKPGKADSVLKRSRTKSPPGASEREQVERFVKDLLVRGEAAKPTKQGKLPLSATHVIVKERKDGTAEVKRVRYKAF